jgi:hypothetical protein
MTRVNEGQPRAGGRGSEGAGRRGTGRGSGAGPRAGGRGGAKERAWQGQCLGAASAAHPCSRQLPPEPAGRLAPRGHVLTSQWQPPPGASTTLKGRESRSRCTAGSANFFPIRRLTWPTVLRGLVVSELTAPAGVGEGGRWRRALRCVALGGGQARGGLTARRWCRLHGPATSAAATELWRAVPCTIDPHLPDAPPCRPASVPMKRVLEVKATTLDVSRLDSLLSSTSTPAAGARRLMGRPSQGDRPQDGGSTRPALRRHAPIGAPAHLPCGRVRCTTHDHPRLCQQQTW